MDDDDDAMHSIIQETDFFLLLFLHLFFDDLSIYIKEEE